jgi:hypothetical protein
MPLPAGYIHPEEMAGARPVRVCKTSHSETRKTEWAGQERERQQRLQHKKKKYSVDSVLCGGLFFRLPSIGLPDSQAKNPFVDNNQSSEPFLLWDNAPHHPAFLACPQTILIDWSPIAIGSAEDSRA